VLGELPVPARYWEYSARDWHIAVCPQKLEKLRLQMAQLQREAASLRPSYEEDVRRCAQLAEETEAGRVRLRDLREEEAIVMSSEALKREASMQSDVQAKHAATLELATLRAETETLASEVENAARLQLAHCSALREMRIAAKLARVKRGIEAVANEREVFRSESRSQNEELSKFGEAAEALRAWAAELRSGMEEVWDDERAALALMAEREQTEGEELAALRLELTEAAGLRQTGSAFLAVQHQAQEVRRQRVSDLNMRLVGTRVATQRLAKSLQEVRIQGSSTKARLAEVQSRSRPANIESSTCRAACERLAIELQQQRDATAAWQACAADLAQGHQAITTETARVVNASREALFGMPVGLEESRHWCHAGLPMPTH
jgi:hypothetical protein